MKRWIYVVQQRLAITNGEATALLTVSLLLVVGLITGEVRSRVAYFDDSTYAASDRLFRQPALAAGVPILVDSVTEAQTDSGKPAVAAAPPEAAPNERSTVVTSGGLVVDLNRATASELQQLPRIGPKIAERIIEFRNRNGPFRAVSELTAVQGIGAATLARLESYLRVSERTESAATRDPPDAPSEEGSAD